jgi:hypothetical protein
VAHVKNVHGGAKITLINLSILIHISPHNLPRTQFSRGASKLVQVAACNLSSLTCVCVWGSLQWLQRVYVPPIINILLHGTQFRGASLLKPRLLLRRKCYREMCKSVEAPECTYNTLLSVPCLLISLSYLLTVS